MKKFSYAVLTALLVFETFSLCIVPAYAATAMYIDPSAVTYVIQAVAGVVIAIGALITIFRHKIAALFKKNKDVEKKEVHFTEAEDVTEENK